MVGDGGVSSARRIPDIIRRSISSAEHSSSIVVRAMLMPAFQKRRKNSASVGRLIAGYGEIEFLLGWTAGTALACQTPIPLGVSKGEHRNQYEREGLRQIFLVRRESDRIVAAKNISREAIKKSGLMAEYHDALFLTWTCLKIRNLFAHCHWYESKKRGLFFVNIEESAKDSQTFEFQTGHATSEALDTAESYFTSAIAHFNYIAQALAVRNQVAIGPEFSRPQKIRGVKPNTVLFPPKPVR